MSKVANRRDSFRLDDAMHLVAKTLIDEELENIRLDFDSYRLQHCLMSHLVLQRENRKGIMAMVRKHSPEAANYLKLLEDDLLLVASRLKVGAEFEKSSTLTNVNLSSTSIRMETKDQFDLGQRVELFMTLSTSGTNILLIAEVMRIEECESGTSVSLLFVNIHSDDEEAIIRHMAKLQQLQLQARRKN
ncbi:MAG: phosphoribosylamine-glycine ligase [bacterium]|jgi:phosphoribosylamine-glycine ligase